MNKLFILSIVFFLPFCLVKSQSFSDNSSALFLATFQVESSFAEASLSQDDVFAYFNLSEKELKMKAILDAQANYRGKNSGGIWIGVATLLFSPVIGIIPAAVTSGAVPNRKSLNYPDEKLMSEYDYYTTYVQESKKIKKRRTGSISASGAQLS